MFSVGCTAVCDNKSIWSPGTVGLLAQIHLRNSKELPAQFVQPSTTKKLAVVN